MKGYRFHPGLLARREADPNHDPYFAVGRTRREQRSR